MVCEFCKKADFSSFSAKVCKDYAGIEIANWPYEFPKDEQFRYCPMCDEPLADPLPLTLHELREMDGEPVWVIIGQSMYNEKVIGEWRITEKILNDPATYWFKGECTGLLGSDYGKGWFAYRRPPKETT